MERINQFLARRGVASRRDADLLVKAGKVRVNGTVATLGLQVSDADTVTVEGKEIGAKPTVVVIALNKPPSVITAVGDPHGRPTVMGLLPAVEGLVPVGRLDWETAGLLLATNDGELCHRLTHPKYRVRKQYVVECPAVPSQAAVEKLTRGVMLDDGFAKPVGVKLLPGKTSLSVIMAEGRNREVRRICLAAGIKVKSLTRVRIGPVELGTLRVGKWRHLTQKERSMLYGVVDLA